MITEFHTSYFDELTAAQEGWELYYGLLRNRRFKGSFLSMSIDRIQIDLEHYNTPIEIFGTSPSSVYVSPSR